MVEPKEFQDALLAYHARPADREAESVRAAAVRPMRVAAISVIARLICLHEHWPASAAMAEAELLLSRAAGVLASSNDQPKGGSDAA